MARRFYLADIMSNLVELHILESILSKNVSLYKFTVSKLKSTDANNRIIPYVEKCFNIFLKHDVFNDKVLCISDDNILSSLLLQSLQLLSKNEWEGALFYIDKCIGIAPNFFYFYLLRLDTVFLNSSKNDGLLYLKSFSHRFSSNPFFLYNAALILYRFHLLDDAIFLLESLISLNPSNVDAVLLLGSIYLEVDVHKGLGFVTLFHACVPDLDSYLTGFSKLYYKYLSVSGSRLMMSYSLSCINRALEIDPLNLDAILHKTDLVYHSQSAESSFSYLSGFLNAFKNVPQFLLKYIEISLVAKEYTGLDIFFENLDCNIMYSPDFYPLVCKFYLLSNNYSSFYSFYNKAVIFNDKSLSALVSSSHINHSLLCEFREKKLIFICSSISDLLIFIPFLHELSGFENISLLLPENMVCIFKSFDFDLSVYTKLSDLPYDFIYHISSLPIILNSSREFGLIARPILKIPLISDLDDVYADSNDRMPVLFYLSSSLSRPYLVTILSDWISKNNVYPIFFGDFFPHSFSEFSPFFVSSENPMALISAMAYSHIIITDSLVFSIFCNLGSFRSYIIKSFDGYDLNFLSPDCFNNTTIVDVKFDDDCFATSFSNNILGVCNERH